MKAIILAAGYGKRMRPLTDNLHKTMLKIGDKTIIERLTDALIDNRVTDIVVVTGYREDELKYYLINKYENVNFTFVNNERYMETNNIFSLHLAFENIDINDDILLIESDLIIDSNILKRIIETPNKNVALLDKYRSGMDGTVVEVNEGIITKVIPTHLQGTDFDFSDKYKTLNIYKFSKNFCNNEFKKMLSFYAQMFDSNCYYELILGILIYMQRESVYAEIVGDEKWAEVDDPNDLRIAEYIFYPEKRQAMLQASFGGYWSYDILDFCFIRNMYFPVNSMFAEMRNNIEPLLHNYGSKQDMLNEKLSYVLGYSREYLNVLNGAGQAYPILEQYVKGKRGLIPSPTFGEYYRLFETTEKYSDEIGINTDEILKKSKDADVVVFVNPNNPTGSEVPTDFIYKFASQNPGRLVIVDESFIEFSQYPSIITMLEKQPLENVIIIKSLSKSLGAPGVRLGYVYSCNAAFNAHMRHNIPIWNLNSIAEFMMEIMLKHKNKLAKAFEQTKLDRESFISRLKQVKCVSEVYPSGANFILAKFSTDADKLADYLLKEHAVYVKSISSKFSCGQYIRFAVRLPKENEMLVNAIVSYISA